MALEDLLGSISEDEITPAQPKEVQPKEVQPKEVQPKEVQPEETQLEEVQPEPSQDTPSTKRKGPKKSSKKGAAKKTRKMVADAQALTETQVRTTPHCALTDEVKRYIVASLAHCKRRVVIAEIQEKFGISVTRQRLQVYDPNTATGGEFLSQELRDLFYGEREKYKRRIDAVPISLGPYRIEVYQDLLDDARDRGDSKEAIVVLAEARKEMDYQYMHPLEPTPEEDDNCLAATLGVSPKALELPSARRLGTATS